MNLKFRPLNENEIKCRVQSNTDKMAVLLLYKDARVDYDLLDEVVGATNWQCQYEVINGNLYCSIGIYDAEKKEWIWKANCGTEANTEKEKSEASDSFKRAAICWDIGRELYSSPKIKVFLNDDDFYVSNDKKKLNTTFDVISIEYDDNKKINFLQIVDDRGNLRFELRNGSITKIRNNQKTVEAPKVEQQPNFNNEMLMFWHSTEHDYKTLINTYLKNVGCDKFSNLPIEGKQDLLNRLREAF